MVLLLVDQVVLRARADPVPPELVRPLLLLVLHDVEEGLAVAGPGDRVHPRDLLQPIRAAAQVAHVQVVLAEARLVDRVGQLVAVVADLPTAQAEELLARGERVHVEDDLLRGVERRLATQDRVLLSLLRPLVVPVRSNSNRRARVVLLDAREHLAVEPLLQLFGRFHHRVGVRRFGVQVRLDFRCPFVAKPEVIVAQRVAIDLRDVRLLAGDWCGGLFAGARLGRRRAGGEDSGEQCEAAIGHGTYPGREEAPLYPERRAPFGAIAWLPWNGFSPCPSPHSWPIPQDRRGTHVLRRRL